MIDFRSDTFTKPTQAMLQAMMVADVGDDVFGEDPTINSLESYAASLFEMESAIFCPSGTMTNQIAIKCHTQPADEVICDKLSHVYIYEGGGIAFHSLSSVKAVEGIKGMITAQQVEDSINPDDIHKPRTSLVSLENTANRGGGACYNFVEIEKIKTVCVNNNLFLHLDGARLFNALVAKNESPAAYGKVFDSISICLSKGLGAPVGSLLLGNASFIKKARRYRKIMGGGMRQAGFLAAAGLYALQNHVDRLSIDHQHAKALAEILSTKDFVKTILPVETNILICEIEGRYSANDFVEKLKEEGIFLFAISQTQVRFVFHLDVTVDMVNKTIEVISKM